MTGKHTAGRTVRQTKYKLKVNNKNLSCVKIVMLRLELDAEGLAVPPQVRTGKRSPTNVLVCPSLSHIINDSQTHNLTHCITFFVCLRELWLYVIYLLPNVMCTLYVLKYTY